MTVSKPLKLPHKKDNSDCGISIPNNISIKFSDNEKEEPPQFALRELVRSLADRKTNFLDLKKLSFSSHKILALLVENVNEFEKLCDELGEYNVSAEV